MILGPAISLLYPKSKIIDSKSKRTVLILLAIVSSLSCISYSEHVTPEFMDDFRFIPIVLVQLFLGIRAAIVIDAFILLATCLLSSHNTYESTVISVLVMITVSAFNYFENVNNRKQIDYGLALKLMCYLFLVKISSFMILNVNLLKAQTFYNLIFIPFAELFVLFIFLYIVEVRGMQLEKEAQYAAMEKQRVTSELAASIAHEIRNPITVVKGFVQLIQQAGSILSKEKIEEYLELCDSELDRAEYVIKDYLSFSRPQAEHEKPVETSINTCFTKMISIVKGYSLLNSIEFVYDLREENDIKIVAYKERLEQILINIVKNAIEASASQTHSRVEIGAIECDKEILIFVQDNGTGFTEQQIKMIGTAYQTTKSTGTGLGLMVCKRLIEEMNGRLQIVSELGKGSLIKIYIPISV
jgi:two-component system sporulation sensor kinase B